MWGCFWLPRTAASVNRQVHLWETLPFLPEAEQWWFSAALTLSSCEQRSGVSYEAGFLSHRGIKHGFHSSPHNKPWKESIFVYSSVQPFIAVATEPNSPWNTWWSTRPAREQGRRPLPALAALLSSLPSTHGPAPPPAHGAADTEWTPSVPCGIPLGSAPSQKESNSPRRCSEGDLETKVKWNSFAHPCNWNRGEGSFPTAAFSRRLGTVNPGTATVRARFPHVCPCSLCFISVYTAHPGALRFTACCWAAAGQSLLPPGRLNFSVGLCLNKSSQKYFVPSHTPQFCISGSI